MATATGPRVILQNPSRLGMHRLRLLLRSPTPLAPAMRHPLVGVLHAWLGEANAFHDRASAYAVGRVQPATADAPHRATHTWTIGLPDDALASALAAGIAQRPYLFPDVPIVGMTSETPPDPWPQRTRWRTDSPLLLRVSQHGRKHHLAWDYPEAPARLADALRRRLALVGVDAETPFDLGFEPPGSVAMEDVHGRACPTSHVGLWLDAPPPVQHAVWACGVGQNTGLGFGMLTLEPA